MSVLYKLPLGTSILEQFVSELAGEEAALLILPNRYQMEKVKFSAVPSTGVDTLANRILNENGYVNFEQINRRSQELLVEELINYMHAEGHFSYFDKLYAADGFLKAMTSFMGQLANTGLSEEEIQEHFHQWAQETNRSELQILKDKEVVTLYRLYRMRLKQENWYDLEGKYRLAVYLLKKEETKLPWKKIRVFGFYTLDNLQIELFRELAKRVDLGIAMYYGDGEVYNACRDTYNSLLAFCEERAIPEKTPTIGQTLVRNIFKDNSLAHSSSLSTEGLELASFPSRDKEIRYVFTKIKELLLSGTSPKDIVVIVRNLANFTGLGAIADEYGLPISLGRTCKLSAHPIFRLLRLFYQASQESHEGAEAYFALLKNSFVTLASSDNGKNINKLREEKYFTSASEARVTLESLEETNDFVLKINALLASLSKKQSLALFAKNSVDFLELFTINELLGREYREGRISIQELKSTTEAHKELLACIDMVSKDYELCGRQEENMYPSEWLEILAEAASMIDISLSRPRADGVRIMEAANMQGLNYKYVFLMGLRNGEFPVAKNESWVYSDKERLGLNMDLPTTAFSFAEDAYFFGSSLASAEESIFISYHAEDEGEKSAYVDELQRIFLTLEDGKITSKLPIMKPENKDFASLNEVFEKYGRGVELGNLSTYINKENILCAQHCADMESFPHFHGKLQDAAAVALAKKQVGNTFSASSLKAYQNCPYAFLLDKVLDLGDGTVREEEGGATDNGTIIHNTLSEFLNKHLKVRLDPEQYAAYLEELDAVFDGVWADYLATGKVHNSSLWQSEKARIRRLLHNWLKDEIKNQQEWDYRPLATEVKFSRGNAPINLELTDGSKINLQGAIDRIDANAEKLFLTDYKLSASSVPTQTDICAGEDLQMNIYLLAAEKMYDSKIAGGGYYVIKGLDRKPNLLLEDVALIKATKKNKPFEHWEEFAGVAKEFITELVERIYQGDFTPSGENCTFCPYEDVCRIKEAFPEKEENNA